MEQLIELLKYLSAALAVLAPLFKIFPGRSSEGKKKLEERHSRIKAFFDEGGTERHAFLVESAFGAAMGHTKLSAVEIPIILRQKKPTQFMGIYLRVRVYLAPDKTGTTLELQSIAKHAHLRKTLVFLGFIVYVVLVCTAVWLLFYLAPRQISAQSWGNLLGTVSVAVLFSSAAAYCLMEASRLHWAAGLHSTQSATN